MRLLCFSLLVLVTSTHQRNVRKKSKVKDNMPPPIAMGPGLPTHVKQKGITVQDFVFFTKEERDRYSAKLKKLADRTEQINEDRPRHPPHFNTDEALQEAYKLRMIINSNKTAESDSYVFHEHRVFPNYLDDVPSITELDESMSQDIKDIDELEKRYQKLRKDILLKKRSVNKRLKEKGAIAKKDDSRQKRAIVKREEDGTVMHLVVCLSRGSITINGLGRMCSVCVHETTLPADR